MIKLDGISKTYELGESEVRALDDISMKIGEGDFIGLHGPSGSGKTTLLRVTGLLETPDDGKYVFDGEDLAGKSHRERSRYRKEFFGFIFQTFNLIPELTVYENVEIPLMISGEKGDKRDEKIKEICGEVGLGDRLGHRPSQLSGGQMQRVSVARALVKDPTLTMADEPTANLDSRTGSSVMEVMEEMNDQHGTTFFFATHDPNVTDYLREVHRIKDGKIL